MGRSTVTLSIPGALLDTANLAAKGLHSRTIRRPAVTLSSPATKRFGVIFGGGS
jgi:hypothetical protein